MEPGTSIPVFYLPEQPENNRVLQAFDLDNDFFKNLLISFCALIFLAGSICILWGNIQKLRAKQSAAPTLKSG